MQFQLKELAYLEVDTNFQYYIYSTSEDIERKRAYEEIYNNYKYKADVKSKIGPYVAEVNSSFIAYYKLSNKNLPDTLNTSLDDFTNHILNLPGDPELEDGIEFTTSIFDDKLTALTAEYTTNISELLAAARALN